MKLPSDKIIFILLVVTGAILFLPFLGNAPLFDWDEANFAESAREMVVTGNYQQVTINYEPFWQKPPLFFWMQAVCMNVFGVNEFAARLPNALCGIATFFILFIVGKRVFNRSVGLFWVLAYAGSLLPHFYFRTGIIDPVFNLFIFLGICFLASGVNRDCHAKLKYFALAGFCTGLAILTKGPVALLLVGACALSFFALQKFRGFPRVSHIAVAILMSLLPFLLWQLPALLKGNTAFLENFITYHLRLAGTEDAGHGGFPGYHLLVILLGCFPASFFAIAALCKTQKMEPNQQAFKRWMVILLGVVLVVFSIVQTKIVHYSSLAYFPVTFLAALTMERFCVAKVNEKNTIGKALKIALFSFGFLIAGVFIAFPFFMKNAVHFAGQFGNEFTNAALLADVSWSELAALPGLVLVVGLFVVAWYFKKGKITSAIVTLFFAGAISINLAITFIFPKVLQHTQGAAIEFYQSKATEDCYVDHIGGKTFLDLFYTKKPLPDNPNHADSYWLMRKKTGKPTYFVIRIDRLPKLEGYDSKMVEIDRKDGFVFYKRTQNE